MMSRAALLAVLLLPGAAGAATWKVGPGAEITSLRQAGRQVQDGDRVEILPGEYYECAVWQANNLVITGPEDPATPAVLSDVACEGKASVVCRGGDVTVRHLTFTRVRVGDGNGAGIRAEGRNLTVEHSRFVNNQVGLLAGDRPDGVLVVRDSFNARQQGQGQALYASVSGVGGGLGALYAGYSWSGLGPTLTFYIASLVALLGTYIIYRYMPERQS